MTTEAPIIIDVKGNDGSITEVTADTSPTGDVRAPVAAIDKAFADPNTQMVEFGGDTITRDEYTPNHP